VEPPAPLAGTSRAPRRLPPEALLGVLDAAIAAGGVFALARLLLSPVDMAVSDFTVFRTGWSLILHGHADRLYDAAAQADVQRALLSEVGRAGFRGGLMAFLHPPHAALAGCVLGVVAERFGAPLAFRLWTLASVALLARLARDVAGALGGGRRTLALVAIALAAFYPVLIALQEGQVSVLLAVAALGSVLALGDGRPLAAAAWLLVLSIKPQTLPPLLAVLAARGERRVLALAAALGAAAVLVTALALGPHVWSDYVARLPALERFFGAGTPVYMPTLRGLLTRLLGSTPGRDRLVEVLAGLAWAAAIAAAAVVALRTRRAAAAGDRGARDARAPLGFALALGALTSPHLFPQDVVLWAAPVTLVLALCRDRDPAVYARRARIVLAWPLWFVLARAVDVDAAAATPRLPVDPTILPLALATVWAGREAARAARAP
jgi:hypothetical protein